MQIATFCRHLQFVKIRHDKPQVKSYFDNIRFFSVCRKETRLFPTVEESARSEKSLPRRFLLGAGFLGFTLSKKFGFSLSKKLGFTLSKKLGFTLFVSEVTVERLFCLPHHIEGACDTNRVFMR